MEQYDITSTLKVVRFYPKDSVDYKIHLYNDKKFDAQLIVYAFKNLRKKTSMMKDKQLRILIDK